jgi:hypothetical protein
VPAVPENRKLVVPVTVLGEKSGTLTINKTTNKTMATTVIFFIEGMISF